MKLLLRVLRQDVVRTQRKRLAQITATTTDTTRIQLVKVNARWLREFMAHDPAPSLAATQSPVLAITGSSDVQVDPADVRRICQLVTSDCSCDIVDGLTHLLRLEAGPPSLRTYKKQAKRPIDGALLARIGGWLDDREARDPAESAQRE